MISRGVEISIAGGGGEMVRSYLLVGFSFFFSFFFYIMYLLLRYKNSDATLAMA